MKLQYKSVCNSCEVSDTLESNSDLHVVYCKVEEAWNIFCRTEVIADAIVKEGGYYFEHHSVWMIEEYVVRAYVGAEDELKQVLSNVTV